MCGRSMSLAHHAIPNDLGAMNPKRHRISSGHNGPQKASLPEQAVQLTLTFPSKNLCSVLDIFLRDGRQRKKGRKEGGGAHGRGERTQRVLREIYQKRGKSDDVSCACRLIQWVS